MSLISLVYPTKHIIYQNLGEIGEMPCPTLFGGYVVNLLNVVCELCHGETCLRQCITTVMTSYPPAHRPSRIRVCMLFVKVMRIICAVFRRVTRHGWRMRMTLGSCRGR